jgi:membrane protease YdiL (CAAX protease family)
LRPGIVGGLIGGLLLVVAQYWQPNALQMVQEEVTIPTSVGILYGGITEEIMLRWGLMSFVAWVGLRLFYQSRSSVPATPYVVAIVVTALLFGAGHLPVLYAYVDDVTLPLVTYVVGINTLFGIVAGFLYWKYGLEASIMAHSTAHLFAYAPSLFGGWIG